MRCVLCAAVKHNGDLTMDQIVEIAKTMRPRSMARHLSGEAPPPLFVCVCVCVCEQSSVCVCECESCYAGTVKEILGTCQSVGCTVDGSHPHDKVDDINDGTITIEVSPKVISLL